MTKTINEEVLVQVFPLQHHSNKEDVWMFPEDVAALLNLMDYVIYGTSGYDHYGEKNYKAFCDVWTRQEFEGGANAVDGRVFDSNWVNTQQEAIDAVIKWVRDGMPNGFGEYTGKVT